MDLLTIAVYLPITAALLFAVYLMSGWLGLVVVAFFPSSSCYFTLPSLKSKRQPWHELGRTLLSVLADRREKDA